MQLPTGPATSGRSRPIQDLDDGRQSDVDDITATAKTAARRCSAHQQQHGDA